MYIVFSVLSILQLYYSSYLVPKYLHHIGLMELSYIVQKNKQTQSNRQAMC